MEYARQRTDRLHGTIYLSAFESELSSTPFFYRLHDIYQGSTVYLTFPSNRIKRYEHSLGAMALASELLFSSMTNANTKVRMSFIEQLNAEFKEIYKKTLTKGYSSSYFGDGIKFLSHLIKTSKYGSTADKAESSEIDRMIEGDIRKVFSSDLLSDDALNHFSLHSIKQGADKGDATHSGSQMHAYSVSVDRERFIYQCILQSVRIVALFHDVGHPPYSHIIESVLDKLYKNFPSVWDLEKREKLKDTLGRFLESKAPLIFHFINTEKPSASPHLHEQVGIHMFRMAVEFVMPDLLKSLSHSSGEKWTPRSKMVVALYYITSIEFAAAILLEKNDLFRSIHRIIDGIVDADRLDYVVRDSIGSGVDWGAVPYKRLIDSAKLFQIKPDGTIDESGTSGLFVIAYPQKVSSDIEDFLLERYKIFVRINYHHRCIKTSVALQSAVNILAEDYLRNPSTPLPPINESGLDRIDEALCHILDGEDSGNPEDSNLPHSWEKSFPVIISRNIHNLWTSLGTTSGDESLKVLRWNDSWMISTLQSALLKIRTDGSFETKYVLQAIRKEWHDVHESPEWMAKSLNEKTSHINDVMSKRKEELEELKKNLEEFLLNKKAYYSLFKRGMDAKYFIDDVMKYAELSISKIEIQLEDEMQKYYDAIKINHSVPQLWQCLDDSESDDDISAGNAVEAVKRLNRFLEAAKVGDLNRITSIFPPNSESAKEIISNVLCAAVENGDILDFKVYVNDGRKKNGVAPS